MKKHILLTTLLASVVLSGCSFHGVWPQSYDGIEINNQPESNAVFAETGELLRYDEERRYPFVASEDLVNVPEHVSVDADGDAEEIEVVELEPGEYVVGEVEGLEAGYYMVNMVVEGWEAGGAAVVVRDTAGVQILEISLSSAAHLMLNDGYTVEVASSRNTVELMPVLEMDENFEDMYFREFDGMVMQGMHVVGDTLPSGTYELLSLELNVMRADGTPQVFVNSLTELAGAFAGIMMQQDMMMGQTPGSGADDETAAEEDDSTEDRVIVELNDGDVVLNERLLVMEVVE